MGDARSHERAREQQLPDTDASGDGHEAIDHRGPGLDDHECGQAQSAAVRVDDDPEGDGQEQLAQAREAFLTGSIMEIMPLTCFAGRPVGAGEVGPVTSRLQQAYHRLVAEEC